jgi:phage terminase small subunit
MPRKADPEREKAFEIYKQHKGDIDLIEIAKQLNHPPGTIRGWKNKDRWNDRINGTLQTKIRNVPKMNCKKKPNSKTIKSIEKRIPELTQKQVIFVGEYLIDFNATRAAIAAGYSKKTAYSIGWELLRKPEIQREIDRQTSIVVKNLGITSQRVLLECLKIAFANISNYMDFGQKEVPIMGMFGPVTDKDGEMLKEKVNYVALKESSEVDGTLIKEIKQSKNGTTVKLYDKFKGLDVLIKRLDILPDNFNRMMEEEKLKLLQQKIEIERMKLDELPGDEPEADDGFMEALRGRTKEVWKDEE